MTALYPSQHHSTSIRKWFLTSRPWSFTAAVIPIFVGTALACTQVSFKPFLFLLTALAGILLQAAVNYLNTYGDFISRVDTSESVTESCGQIVRGELSPESVRRAGFIALCLGALAGAIPVWFGGIPVLCCGVIGILGAAFYTTFFPYKYKGFGPPFVFVLMGPLMVLPAWYVQGGEGWLLPLLVSLPIGCFVVGIMHGNDIRDIAHDHAAHIVTPAIQLGLHKAIVLYKILYISAYVILFALVGTGLLPWTALLPILLLPLVYKTLWGLNAQSSRERIITLEGISAKLHLLFGLLLNIGILLSLIPIIHG